MRSTFSVSLIGRFLMNVANTMVLVGLCTRGFVAFDEVRLFFAKCVAKCLEAARPSGESRAWESLSLKRMHVGGKLMRV
jgi:hypothetical protein